jgi:DNA mismatch repair ATPase MutS
MVGQLPEGPSAFLRLGEAASNPDPGAVRAIRGLIRITDTAGIRHSSLAHFALVTLFVWDVHLLDRLERWHAKHAKAALRWVQTVGELEVVAALGGLVYDYPDWTFPEFVDESQSGISGASLGHPLLESRKCVRNDVALPPPGRLLVVTGSNMAGKTTLLRGIGVNQVLALLGGPVAADRMRTRPLLPWCVMRVRDDLESGVSYFLAELQRLKRVVDAAEAGPILYLLDEILQGTNSAERQTAARIVLGRLACSPAIGGITTHDLELAATGELETRAEAVHFREEVIERDGLRNLEFDYLLRPGPATSRNALLLLEMVGLESDRDRGDQSRSQGGSIPPARPDPELRGGPEES